MTSISTAAPRGKVTTATVVRAGYGGEVLGLGGDASFNEPSGLGILRHLTAGVHAIVVAYG